MSSKSIQLKLMKNISFKNAIFNQDCSLVLLISKDEAIVDGFRKVFPLSEDLAEYNSKLAGKF